MWALGVLSLAGCSSGPPSAGHPSTTPTTAARAPASTVPSSAAPPGTKLPASGPTGVTVQISATRAQQGGVMFGGPTGSWDTGIEITNSGSSPYAFNPVHQVVLVDSAGRHHIPLDTGTAQPIVVAAGGEAGRILVFTLPTAVTPAATQLTPFPGSGSTLVWSAT